MQNVAKEETKRVGLTRDDADDGDAKPGGKSVENASAKVPRRFSLPFPNDPMAHPVPHVVPLPVDRVEIVVFD